jgi:hypothetical protein
MHVIFDHIAFWLIASLVVIHAAKFVAHEVEVAVPVVLGVAKFVVIEVIKVLKEIFEAIGR